MRPIPLLPTFKPRKEISMRQLGELNLCPLECVWLMPEKSKKKNAGVSSWQKRITGCSSGSNFTPSTKRFVSCGSDLRATCQGELVSSCLSPVYTQEFQQIKLEMSCQILEAQKGILSDQPEECIHLHQRNYKWDIPNKRVGWGSPKNPQKCSVCKRMSLNTCQDQTDLRPTHQHQSGKNSPVSLSPSRSSHLSFVGSETKRSSQRRSRSAEWGKKKRPPNHCRQQTNMGKWKARNGGRGFGFKWRLKFILLLRDGH